jgi:hypothetical protein
MMVSLEACLIVKNEEAMLARCLESLKGFDIFKLCVAKLTMDRVTRHPEPNIKWNK